jgi:glycosyltransferase involved in cell wall biosynthesis
MTIRSRTFRDSRFLFDIRGFWADERVEGGLWNAGGVLYRLAKHYEKRFFSEADAIVTLTEASVPQIRSWLAPRKVPIEVIPTCVEVNRFGMNGPRPGGPAAIWSGSIGTWYRFDLAPKLAAALGLPLRVLTRQVDRARAVLGSMPATVKTVAPDGVPAELYRNDVGLCLVHPSFSKTASAPTRFAEHLAAGNPVVALAGVGDMDAIIQREGVGVVLPGDTSADIERAGAEARDLMSDPQTPERCIAVAERLFSLERGVTKYRNLYRRLWADLG